SSKFHPPQVPRKFQTQNTKQQNTNEQSTRVAASDQRPMTKPKSPIQNEISRSSLPQLFLQRFHLFLKAAELRDQLGEAAEGGLFAEGLAVGEGRHAADDRSRGDILRDG